MKLRTALDGCCAVAGLGLLWVYLVQIWFAKNLDFEGQSLAYYLVGSVDAGPYLSVIARVRPY